MKFNVLLVFSPTTSIPFTPADQPIGKFTAHTYKQKTNFFKKKKIQTLLIHHSYLISL